MYSWLPLERDLLWYWIKVYDVRVNVWINGICVCSVDKRERILLDPAWLRRKTKHVRLSYVPSAYWTGLIWCFEICVYREMYKLWWLRYWFWFDVIGMERMQKRLRWRKIGFVLSVEETAIVAIACNSKSSIITLNLQGFWYF